MPATQRPVYLDVFKIKLPLPGVISFAHRVSGALMFLGIPFVLYLLDLSLSSPAGFAQARDIATSWWLVPAVVLITWSLCHHLLAGVRYLLMDLEIGIAKKPSFQSAAWVGVSALVLAIILLLEIYL
ncbi:MAG: succinate dehydrogenase, cytochrome b556 subunit [Acidihalobacter sp.]|jgi:succinate dehydrogenase / fumarate reductase cytochrome b subunit